MQSHVRRISDWTQGPSTGTFSVEGFGNMSKSSGSGVTYKGNVGSPYGSNIIVVSADTARNYQNVVRFTGCNTDSWAVVIWNKYGPDDRMDGWYGNACHHFTLMSGEVKFFAFMNNSQGGFAAAQGSTIPTDSNGGYASTWGSGTLRLW
ncbi:hypothetical protein N7494_013246 [Penicillium frequentans]|uniref:Uncharacterized protein n=1 Tax=Penicillium frequentans TaxID=3151616 RepID=A0AAD6CHH1_9EURO|nr:hypothetical protein N7494_013246 [Penicillium glabrum]